MRKKTCRNWMFKAEHGSVPLYQFLVYQQTANLYIYVYTLLSFINGYALVYWYIHICLYIYKFLYIMSQSIEYVFYIYGHTYGCVFACISIFVCVCVCVCARHQRHRGTFTPPSSAHAKSERAQMDAVGVFCPPEQFVVQIMLLAILSQNVLKRLQTKGRQRALFR